MCGNFKFVPIERGKQDDQFQYCRRYAFRAPMLGRIYASKHFPHILNDRKAMELKGKLPQNIKGQNTQTQYTLMAGAVRSANMDRYIRDFLKRNPNGIIAELGCGLETTFYRNDNGKTRSQIRNLFYHEGL